jgi:O-antigen/teichoic acid export membrane protein
MFSQHRVDAAGVLWIIAAMSTLATVVGYFLLGSMKYSRSRTMEVVRLHWPNGKWLVGAALSQWISGNLYILALGSAMGAVAVGALRSAQSIMGITHVVFLGLENVIPAEATRAHARGGRSELRQYLRKTAQFSFVATGLFGLVVSIDPNAVMALAFGEEFGAYGHLIWLFVLIYLLVSIGLSVRSGLRALNETRSIFTANVAAAILSIVTATYFTNTYGLLGAALGIFLVQIVIQTWTAADLLRRLTAGEGA